MPTDVEAFELDVLGPVGEIGFAFDDVGFLALSKGIGGGLVADAVIQVGNILQGHRGAADEDRGRAVFQVLGKSGVAIGNQHRTGAGAGGAPAGVGKRCRGLAIGGFGADFVVVGVNVGFHRVLRCSGVAGQRRLGGRRR